MKPSTGCLTEGVGMSKKEDFELAVQLPAQERLLAELLILVRAQRGSSTRLSGFRERIAKELEQDEDHPVKIEPKEQAIHAPLLQTIDAALGVLVENRRRMREQP
jgi:hypothetical protein